MVKRNNSKYFFSMLSHKKLKAFTMMELLVTIVLSSVVIGFALGVYYQINSYYFKNDIQLREVNEVITLHSLMSYDIEKSSELYVLSDRITLQNSNNTVCYKFYDGYLIRESNQQTDTFKINITGIESEKIDPYSDIVSQVSFTAEKNDMQWPFHFLKTYTNDKLFELSVKKDEH